ncbi:hypothetical protein FQZ97_597240 [compost metagenome]
MRPSRKVPAVSTTVRARKEMPTCVTAPTTRSPSIIRSSTACWNRLRFGWFSRRWRIAALYSTRSACARVARTAGPLLELRMRNWMPASSVAMAIAPPSASTSFTRWPLPMPPIDGLQLICPSVSMLWESSSVLAPMRAEASAASVPAWPPPTTITSNSSGYSIGKRGRTTDACAAQKRALILSGDALPQPLCGQAREPRQNQPGALSALRSLLYI